MTTLTMKEEKRLEIIQRVFRGELTVVEAGVVIGVSERQYYRIKARVTFGKWRRGSRGGRALGSHRLHDLPPRSCPPCFTLLLPEVARYRRARIGLDAANLLPAIDDDKVEVYGRGPDKNNGYGAGAVRVHDIGGTLINQR